MAVEDGRKAVSSPTVGNNGLIFVGTSYPYGNGHLYAIERDGGIRWKVETGDIAMWGPAVAADGRNLLTYGRIDFQKAVPLRRKCSVGLFNEGWKVECDVYAIDRDGKLKWKFKTIGGVAQSPTIGADGTVYVADIGDTEHAGDAHHAPPETFYAIDSDGKLTWKLTKTRDGRTRNWQ